MMHGRKNIKKTNNCSELIYESMKLMVYVWEFFAIRQYTCNSNVQAKTGSFLLISK